MALDQLEATLKKQWRLSHGMSQGAHNVGFAIELEGLPLALGMRNR